MGSACVFHLYGGNAVIAAAAEAEVARIEQRYSRYLADSVLSQINAAARAGGTVEVDPETAALIDYAFAAFAKSGGLFDITTGVLRRAWNFARGQLPEARAVAEILPLVGLEKVRWENPRLSFAVAGMELDLGGIGKEYAADRAATVCREAGITSGLIDLGGDLHAIGPHPDGTPWRIRLTHPRERTRALGTVPLTRGGLATSGDYERCIVIDGTRYAHILSPRTGWPVPGMASVTVLADSCLIAGTVATIAMLKGASGPGWLQQIGLPSVWMEDGNRVGATMPLTPDDGESPARA